MARPKHARNLALVMSPSFLVLLLAYRAQRGDTEPLDYVLHIRGRTDAAHIRAHAEAQGLREISMEEARLGRYQQLLLFPAHVYFDSQPMFLAGLTWQELVLCADGFRNSLFIEAFRRGRHYDQSLLDRWRERVTFHAIVEENALRDTLPRDFTMPPTTVVSAEAVGQQWAAILSLAEHTTGQAAPDIELNAGDVLVVTRDWQEDFRYGTASDTALSDVTVAMLETVPNVRRVIFRPLRDNPDPRVTDALSVALAEYCQAQHLTFTAWNDLVGPLADASDGLEIVHPESLLLTGRLRGAGHVIAFDGTVSLLAHVSKSGLQPVWPDQVDLSNTFATERARALATEQASWMRALGTLPAGAVVHTPGYWVLLAHADLHQHYALATARQEHAELQAALAEARAVGESSEPSAPTLPGRGGGGDAMVRRVCRLSRLRNLIR